MFIRGLGTATPPWRYTQQECWKALQAARQFADLNPHSQAILKKILTGTTSIETRYLCLPSIEDIFAITPDILQKRFATYAPLLAAEAAQTALANAQLTARSVDGVIVSTCTGFLCPGLSTYVAERLGLQETVIGLDLAGQGCGAALPNLRSADALIEAGRCSNVLSICVEICTAAFYLDDDPGVLVSACLFGDGAACAVASKQPNPHRTIEWKATDSILLPKARNMLRFEHRNGMLRNVLSPCVPMLAGENARLVLERTLNAASISRNQINTFIFHAGGREVLCALASALDLDAAELRWSEQILKAYGNVSSPSVLFALKAALQEGAPNGLWWMSSFGAGFSCHGALLEVSRGSNG